jgi:hypothetical protein
MGSPAILVENFYSLRQNNGHTLSASENSANAVFVGAARRSVYDAYTSITTNLDAWVRALCDRIRTANMVVFDRGQNVTGLTAKVQLSSDAFVTNTENAFSGALPTVTAAGSLDDDFGVLTPEGAWLKRFNPRASLDWRVFIPAMGASLKPIVTGLWLGQCWTPGDPWRPHSPQVTELVVQETESDLGWIGRGKSTPRKTGVLHFKFATLYDAELAAQHLEHIAKGRAFWIVSDDARADQAFLAVMPKTSIGMVLEPNYFYPTLDLPYVELDPAEIT